MDDRNAAKRRKEKAYRAAGIHPGPGSAVSSGSPGHGASRRNPTLKPNPRHQRLSAGNLQHRTGDQNGPGQRPLSYLQAGWVMAHPGAGKHVAWDSGKCAG